MAVDGGVLSRGCQFKEEGNSFSPIINTSSTSPFESTRTHSTLMPGIIFSFNRFSLGGIRVEFITRPSSYVQKGPAWNCRNRHHVVSTGDLRRIFFVRILRGHQQQQERAMLFHVIRSPMVKLNWSATLIANSLPKQNSPHLFAQPVNLIYLAACKHSLKPISSARQAINHWANII